MFLPNLNSDMAKYQHLGFAGVVGIATLVPSSAFETVNLLKSLPVPDRSEPTMEVSEFDDGVVISDLQIPQECRGKGMGITLLRQVQSMGKPIYLTANPGVESFYSQAGFRKVGNNIHGQPIFKWSNYGR